MPTSRARPHTFFPHQHKPEPPLSATAHTRLPGPGTRRTVDRYMLGVLKMTHSKPGCARKITVDPVSGQVKGRGFRRFSPWGADRVKDEFQLVCAVHNLVKLWRTASAAVRRWSAAREVAYA